MGSMKAALKPIAHKCFRDASVGTADKVLVVRSLLLSRGLFSSSTWAGLTSAESQRIHCNVMYAYRSATASHYCEAESPVSDQHLLLQHGLIAPFTLVRLARLILFLRILQNANQFLIGLVFSARNGKRAWLKSVTLDLAWLASVDLMCEVPVFKASVHWSVQQWALSFRDNPKLAKRRIKELCSLPHANILDGVTAKVSQFSLGAWPCYECGDCLKSRQALAVHSFRKHGLRKAGRFFVERDAVCQACLLMFPTRRRCVEHINEKSPSCLNFLSKYFLPLTAEQVCALDDEDRVCEREARRSGISRARGVGTCVRLFGPTIMSSGVRHPIGPCRRLLPACPN
jgi:hypothetical protein